jgi:predicted metal-dependent phosphoesterase TrpH
MHMLGYWMDLENPELVRQMEWIRDGRDMRNRAMLEKLNALGFAMTWEKCRRSRAKTSSARPHFAQVMLQKGYAKDKNEAFDKWLGDGKPGYADRPRPHRKNGRGADPQGAAAAWPCWPIRSPADRQGRDGFAVVELAAAGLAGVECYYSEHSADLTKEIFAMAKQANLVPTRRVRFPRRSLRRHPVGSGFGGLNVPDEVLAQLEARRGGCRSPRILSQRTQVRPTGHPVNRP